MSSHEKKTTPTPDALPYPVLQPPPRPAAALQRLAAHWAHLRQRIGRAAATAASSSAAQESVADSSCTHADDAADIDERGAVDEVVVDRVWPDALGQTDDDAASECSGTSALGEGAGAGAAVVAGGTQGAVLRRWVCPLAQEFFSSQFDDPTTERHFQNESWTYKKVCDVRFPGVRLGDADVRLLLESLALWSAGFLLISWAFGIAFIPRPVLLIDQIFYYAVSLFPPRAECDT